MGYQFTALPPKSEIHVSGCDEGHPLLTVTNGSVGVTACARREDAREIADLVTGYAGLASHREMWRALKDWLAEQVTHDMSVMEQYRDFGDGGVTSRSHGAMASAKQAVLAKMAGLEAGQ